MSAPDTLDAVLESAWHLLERGAADRRDPFHSPVLVTNGPDGAAARTVILRKVFRDERALLCHSDVRTVKVGDVRHDPRVVWVFYHPPRKVQIRISSPATLHTTDALADRQWAASQVWSRRGYASLPPASVLEGPGAGLPAELATGEPSLQASERGRENFAVLRCVVERLDWLFLDARGNRRAQFEWDAAGAATGRWVVP